MRTFRKVYPGLMLAPLVMVWVRLHTGWWPSAAAPVWLPVVLAILAFADILFAVLMEGQFLHEPLAGKIRAKGQTPE